MRRGGAEVIEKSGQIPELRRSCVARYAQKKRAYSFVMLCVASIATLTMIPASQRMVNKTAQLMCKIMSILQVRNNRSGAVSSFRFQVSLRPFK